MTARRTAIASCSPDAASPAVTTVIDTAEGIVAAFDVTGEPTGECGLVTSQTIPAVRAA